MENEEMKDGKRRKRRGRKKDERERRKKRDGDGASVAVHQSAGQNFSAQQAELVGARIRRRSGRQCGWCVCCLSDEGVVLEFCLRHSIAMPSLLCHRRRFWEVDGRDKVTGPWTGTGLGHGLG